MTTAQSILYAARLGLYNMLQRAEAWGEGYNLDYFDQIYADENSTAEQLYKAEVSLSQAQSLTEYLTWTSDFPIMFADDPDHTWTRNSTTQLRVNTDNYDWYRGAYTMTLTATFVTDEDATLRHRPNYNNNARNNTVEVYLDDQLIRTIDGETANRNFPYFEKIAPGRHTVRWVFKKKRTNASDYAYMNEVGLYKTPLISVNVPVAGQLATEVLNYWSDNNHKIDEVRKLKVTGSLNAQDFATIDMMPMLFSLDISETDVKEIAANEFNSDARDSYRYGGKNNKQYLYEIKLPNGLETIGNAAFRGSYIDEIEFPASLRSIGDEAFCYAYLRKAHFSNSLTSVGHHAFYCCLSLKDVQLSDSITSMGERVFAYCYYLEKANFPKALNVAPIGVFYYCELLQGLTLHEGVTEVGGWAFGHCHNLKFSNIPKTLNIVRPLAFAYNYADTLNLHEGMTIYDYAFQASNVKNLVIPENCTIYNGAFCDSKQMVSVELPTNYNVVTNNYVTYRTANYSNRYYEYRWESSNSSFTSPFANNSALQTVTLKSPTMVNGAQYTNFLSGCGSPTIRVPKYLQNSAYRQDSYWYNYTIEGFSTADVEHWTINAPLTLNGNDRFEGTPNVTLNSTLAINGTAAMSLRNVDLSNGSQVLSDCENIQITDTLSMRITTTGNVWRYLSMPFNFKVSDVKPLNGAHTAFYYYDGASRAQNNSATGNWKRLPNDTIVTAGTGFIFQTSKDETSVFFAVNDGEKQKLFSPDEYVRDLAFNDAESSANRGWNLVGNPYLCYYNLHKLNYTAPITVATSTWNSSYRRNDVTYTAYSIVDDDYAIKPREAFFVQCAAAEASRMTMPVAGRQLSSEITDQTGVRSLVNHKNNRHLMDLTLTDSEERSDRTRVVLNPEASLQYEATTDAAKFMSTDNTMPQIYTLDAEGTEYAINERPESNGKIALAVVIPSEGIYTLKLSRQSHQGEAVMLTDHETGAVVDLSKDSYTFTANAGTLTQRFVLGVDGTTTGVKSLETTKDAEQGTIFDLQGRRIEKPVKGIYMINGKKVVVK